MNILLTTLNAKYIHLNLAIRLLYSLNKHKEGLEWTEFTIKENPEAIAQKCAQYNVVAFSCYIWNITQTLAVARALKQINPEIKILLGGPEVSYDYETFLTLPEVDYIIIGEGEIPFGQFVAQYPTIEGIPNLAYKKDGQLVCDAQQVTFDVNELAGINPYAFDAPDALYNKVCYIETSRGCPYKCEFCLASLDNKVRYLPIDTIKQNLLYLMQHGRTIKFLDRTFNVKKDFTIDIFRFILQHRKPGQVFQFEITADIVHPDIVAFIQQEVPPGVFRFEIGIQTVNQQANLQVSRKQNFDKTSGVIKQLNNVIEMHLDLIIGLPLDRWDDIKHSIESVFALYPPELQLGFLKFLRGTPVRQKHEQHGYVFDPAPPYQLIKSNYLSESELRALGILEEALELYWNKKRALNTLRFAAQHIGIFEFLHALGHLFHVRYHFHKHTLYQVYDALTELVTTHYAQHPHMVQLAAIDYYLQAKIKPQMRYVQEAEPPFKYELLNRLKLPHQQRRYAVLPITFNWSVWEQHQQIEHFPSWLIMEYDGVSAARVCAQVPIATAQLV
ncbi:MAG: B12-binding domain-containing radical SAM protein [Bacteroidia bacterium]|jgi:radical SAM superfamily enzyme YgiQ (UPF0313 family)|nr:B12-binding domain-containing radical SAM protein [Bacteroidia bacterium]